MKYLLLVLALVTLIESPSDGLTRMKHLSPGSAIKLSSIALNPTSVVGGSSSQGTVTLTKRAPSGGVIVTLSSSQPSVASVPASVTIASGQTTGAFTVTTSTVSVTTVTTISASYGGVTKTANLTVAAADTTAPIISVVAASNITTSEATITWTTNEASDTQVDYGTTTAYGSSSTLVSTLVTSHSATLSGLSASTLYHYRVKSRDAAGNLASSGDFTVTTAATDTTPPVISGVTASSITSSGVTISWTTNEASDTQVDYGTTMAYESSTSLVSTLVTNHTATLTGLIANTLYHYRVKSRDAAGNLATSTDSTFTTLASAGPQYYVDATNGNDNNAGTSIGAAWQTLAKAVTVVVAGDTVNFRTGTYTAGSNFQAVAAGSSGSRIVFQRYQNEAVTIVGTSTGVPVFFSATGSSYITLDGFIVDATNGLNVVKINNGSHNWIVKNCELKNSFQTGVLVPDDGNNGSNLIQNCNIHNNGGTDLDHGIYLENADNLVEGCEIHDNLFGYGIQIYQNGANNLRNVIRRNYTHGNGLAGIIVGTGSQHLVYNNIFADRATIRYGGSCVFANNTVYTTDTVGITLEINNFPNGIASPMVIENNIIWGGLTGIYPYQLFGIAITIRNNLVVHQAGDEYNTDGSGSVTLTNNRLDKTATNTTGTYHPNFVTLGSDFHIQTASSAKDAGFDASGLFTTDYDGNARPQGSAWDIGAYELPQ